jgi:hypothetical protein
MLYTITVEYWTQGQRVLGASGPHGYNAHDYLPGFAEQSFASHHDGYDWIDKNHKGPDSDGISVVFGVVRGEG